MRGGGVGVALAPAKMFVDHLPQRSMSASLVDTGYSSEQAFIESLEAIISSSGGTQQHCVAQLRALGLPDDFWMYVFKVRGIWRPTGSRADDSVSLHNRGLHASPGGSPDARSSLHLHLRQLAFTVFALGPRGVRWRPGCSARL